LFHVDYYHALGKKKDICRPKSATRSNILKMREPIPVPTSLRATTKDRLEHIMARRKSVLFDGIDPNIDSYVEQSWLRCLQQGKRPNDAAVFQAVMASDRQYLKDANQQLLCAAQFILKDLAESIANTGYFALLTDSNGTVLQAQGRIDLNDKRAKQLTSEGVDLSENAIGTTAIGTALASKDAVWLHRGEHFLESNRIYSCAGAPIFGVNNECVGMLDLTGIEVAERQELKFLAARSARAIQDEVIKSQFQTIPQVRLLQIQWFGSSFDGAGNGLLAIRDDGQILACNRASFEWLPDLATDPAPSCETCFSMATPKFFAEMYNAQSFGAASIPLWSGLQVQARWLDAHCELPKASEIRSDIKSHEADLIRQAMRQCKGNVETAAQRLGISRATLYRKLHKRRP
jgi:sigma-54 dependent transcriptional regulator, acetoin dehydrogenase operon transcriptional activator AcoR